MRGPFTGYGNFHSVTEKFSHWYLVISQFLRLLRPTKGATEGPNNCPGSPFNASALEPIQTELEDHWPSIAEKNGADFWTHEWKKHGTCALEDKGIFDSEYTYFKLGLDWNNRYNVTRVLNEAGITPTNLRSYSKDAFHDVIKSAWGKAPNLECYYYKVSKFVITRQYWLS